MLFTLADARMRREVRGGRGGWSTGTKPHDARRVECGGPRRASSRRWAGSSSIRHGWRSGHGRSRPFADVDALHAAMVTQVESGAPPRSNWRCCGPIPTWGRGREVSDASRGEQAGAGLDRLTAEEFEPLNDSKTRRIARRSAFRFCSR